MLPYSPHLILAFLAIFTFTLWKTWNFSSKTKESASKQPPGPVKLPLIGNLHLLIGTRPHHYLRDLANKYGPVMHLQLGEASTVVISSPEAAKEMMKTKDSNFLDRPYFYAAESITYNFKDILFSRGDYWREMRKICVLQLFTSKRVKSFGRIREEHISNLVRTISAKQGTTVNLRDMLYSLSVGLISQAAFGGKCKHQEAYMKILPEIVALFGGLSIVDLYPSLKILNLINSLRPKYKQLYKKVDDILDNIIQEHRAGNSTARINDSEAEAEDLVQVLLSVQDQTSLSTTSIKAVIFDVFMAGGETSATASEWVMIELARNPKVMEKAQEEVRHVFGKKGYVDEAGLGELKYLNQVIKETFRLHPPAPLLMPRESKESCEINGYTIPAKTRIIVNAWAIGRDPNYWNEADKFIPERFSDSLIDYKGADFQLIPFGAGRRICPGISYGMAVVELTLANLLYHFDWKLPNGKKSEDLDMTEVFDTVIRPKNDLRLVPIPCEINKF